MEWSFGRVDIANNTRRFPTLRAEAVNDTIIQEVVKTA